MALATWRLAVSDEAAAELIVQTDERDDAPTPRRPRISSLLYSREPSAADAVNSRLSEGGVDGYGDQKATNSAADTAQEGAAAKEEEEEKPPANFFEAIEKAAASAIATMADVANVSASDEVVGNGDSGVGGAGGLSFEEYVVLRRFAQAPCLEEQVCRR